MRSTVLELAHADGRARCARARGDFTSGRSHLPSDRGVARRGARGIRQDPAGPAVARSGRGRAPGGRHVHQRHQLDRHIEVTTEPVWVEWDAVRLDQVLTNLMTNAVKYTPPGGRIRVTLREEAGEAVLSVEDTGFGITPRLLPFIFDMYTQADRTLDRAQGGLGIGLTLVRRLVELHGGTIVASSEGEGRGSTFTVRLAPDTRAVTHRPVLHPRRNAVRTPDACC